MVLGLGGWLALDSAAADGNVDLSSIGIIPALENVCADFVSVGIPMLGDGDGSGSISVPGDPIVAVLEWAGHEDTSPGGATSTLSIELTASPAGGVGPVEVTVDALPPPAGVSIVPPPDNEPVYAWAADVSALFPAAGDYDLRVWGWDSLPWFSEGIASWGSTLTVIYDTSPCAGPADISWRSGADVYWGGTTAAEEQLWGEGIPGNGHVTEPFVFTIDPAAEDRVLEVQFTTGGNSQGAGGCRETDLWYAAGNGSPSSADLVTFTTYGQPFGTASTGAVEIVRNPFSDGTIGGGVCAAQLNPTDSVYQAGHVCPSGPVPSCPYRALGIDPSDGGNIGPEWAVARIEVAVPAGTTWLSFQLESPTDLFATTGVSPESGAWAGQVILRVPRPTAPIDITKVATGEIGGLPPGAMFELALDCDNDAFDQPIGLAAGATATVTDVPIGTVCSVTETGTTPLLPGHVYDPPVITPAVVTVGPAGVAAEVVVENPIRRETGRLEVIKRVTGPISPAGGEYGFALDCDGTTHDTAFSIGAGGAFLSDPIPVGTVCTVSEVSVPPLDPGLIFEPVAFSPGATVQIELVDQVVTVVAENPVRRTDGSLRVTKNLVGDAVGYQPGTSFTFLLDCDGDGFDATFTLVAAGSYDSGPIPPGTACTLSETAQPPAMFGFEYEPPVFVPADTVTIGGSGQAVSVVVDNPLRRLFGTVEVTKSVSGAAGGLVDGSVFGFALDCDDDGFDATFSIAAGSSFTSDPIPVGTSCSVTETSVPAPAPGFAYDAPVIAPATPVTIVEDAEVVSFAVDNPLRRLRGAIEVTKLVSGETAGLVPGSTFVMTVDCDVDALDASFELVAGQSFVVDGVPVGTGCTVNETAVPAAAAGFAFASPAYQPAPTATVLVEDETVPITVVNPIERLTGRLEVVKTISGATTGYVEGSTFGFELDCDDDAFDAAFELGPDEAYAVDGIPVGVQCAVAEVGPATAAPGFDYEPPVVTPPGPVTIVETGATVTVAFDNPLRGESGTVRVTKVVTGLTQGMVEGSTFTLTFDCDGDAFDQAVEVIAGEPAELGEIPAGTTCVVGEVDVPAAATGFVYADPVVSPELVVITGDEVIDVLVENPIELANIVPPRMGRISVTKRVSGPAAGFVDGSVYEFELVCDNEHHPSTRFTLERDQRFTTEWMSVGTTCSLHEIGVAAAANGFGYGRAKFSPSATITIGVAGQVVEVVVDNPLTPELVATGVDTWPLIRVGSWLLMLGLLTAWLARRRRTLA